MKNKIAILGSTGSIGINTFEVIKENRKKFDIVLLTTNKNINKVLKQVKIFKVKNITGLQIYPNCILNIIAFKQKKPR